MKETLIKQNFNERIINHLSNVACLSNYGQDVNIDGFVGLVSIAGTVGDLWSVKYGNKSVPCKLLEQSGAQLLISTHVKSIGKSASQPSTKNLIVYQTHEGQEISDDTFDYVIIALPIYNQVIGDQFAIDFDLRNDFNELKMQQTNTYFISGTVKLFPDLPANKRIELHSVEPGLPYRTICVQLPCDYNEKKDARLYLDGGPKFYKIFSDQHLNTAELAKIFEPGFELIQEMPWLAYPKYDAKLKTMPDIILDAEERERVYYLNAMEWTSSCMEISCVSARNVSLLIADKEADLVVDLSKKKFFKNKILNQTNVNKLLRKSCAVFSFFSIVAFLTAVFVGKN